VATGSGNGQWQWAVATNGNGQWQQAVATGSGNGQSRSPGHWGPAGRAFKRVFKPAGHTFQRALLGTVRV